MFLTEAIQNFDEDRMALPEIIALSAHAHLIKDRFASLGIDEPPWLTPQIEKIDSVVAVRVRDARAKKIREMKAQLEALTPAEEKRTALLAAIKELEAKLA